VRRAAILAVDGGGSKVDAVLLRRSGEVIAARRVPSRGWAQTGDDGFIAQVGAAVEAVCADAGVVTNDGPVADVGIYCLAGADLPVDVRRISKALRRRGWTARDVLRNDTFAVLRAGTERDWGVAVVCGSGINCTGVAPGGRILRFPALGEWSGDWGGGHDVGSAALFHAVRAQDGRGSRTSLRRAVPEHFGLRRPSDVTEALYLGRIEPRRLNELPPIVFGEAVAGDAVARGIVEHQADEVVTMAATAIRRLRMSELDPDVVLGGGLFRSGDDRFFERIEAGLRAAASRARIVRLAAPPVVGAAMLALDEGGGNRAAHARARARRSLTHERLAADTSARARKD
jgi:N-acetylglucosamine kinase-like BadF-type ATPase